MIAPRILGILAALALLQAPGLYGQDIVAQSPFHSDLEGWTLQAGGATVTWSDAETCSGGSLTFTDDSEPNSWVIAPQIFHGNWASLLGPAGSLRFQQRLISVGTCSLNLPRQVRISGPGGAAEWTGGVPTGLTTWEPLSVPLLESEWSVVSGTWPALLADVDSLQIRVDFSDNCSQGQSTGLDNVQLLNLEDTFDRGDCNQDSETDIGDAINVLGVLFSGASSPNCLDACDVNDDGVVDIGDVIYLLGYFFSNGPGPAAPTFTWGLDPTPDSLPCTSYGPSGSPPLVFWQPGCASVPVGFAMRGDIGCLLDDGVVMQNHPWTVVNGRWEPEGCVFANDLDTIQFILQFDVPGWSVPGEPDLFYLLQEYGVPSCLLDIDQDGLISPCDISLLDSLLDQAPDPDTGLLDLLDPSANDCLLFLEPGASWGIYPSVPDCP